MKKTTSSSMILFSGIIIGIMFLLAGYTWTQVPAGAEVCTHWNGAGVCDDYGGKFTGILLFPIIAIGVVALLAVIPRIEPRANNLEQSRKAYHAVWAVLLLFLLGFYLLITLEILGVGANFSVFAPILLGMLFIVMGNYLGKIRSNFMFGIRTPWTLASDLSWNKTHRLGGKLMMGMGIIFVISGLFLSPEAWATTLTTMMIGLLVILMGYSYWVWKNDPNVVKK